MTVVVAPQQAGDDQPQPGFAARDVLPGGGAASSGTSRPIPRSPTGRVPQWVLDERAGRARQPEVWRSPERPLLDGLPAPGHPSGAGGSAGRPGSPRRTRGHALPWFLAILVVVTLSVVPRAVAYPGGLARFWADLPASAGTVWADPPPQPVPGRDGLPARRPGHPTPGREASATPLGTPPPVPSTDRPYAFIATQPVSSGASAAPVAWSPCRPVHYVVNPTGAPADFSRYVAGALAELSAATGLVFVDDGVTDEVPAADRGASQPDRYGDRWAPVLVAFTDPTSVADLAGDVAGVGGGVSVTDPATGLVAFVSGGVYLDSSLLSRPVQGGEPAYLPVLRHELGHLVGLGHVDDPTQLMYPRTSWARTYAEGDRVGLARLGRAACTRGL